MSRPVAIVTGGAAGIGKAIVEALIEDGYLVVACDLAEERGKALENQHAGSVIFRRCDVSSESDVEAVVDGVLREFGRIDALVNNAGIIRRRTSEAMNTEDWDAVFAVNARGRSSCAST